MYSDGEAGCNWNANYFNIRSSAGVLLAAYAPTFIIEPNGSTYNAPGSSTPMNWNFTNNIVQGGCTEYWPVGICRCQGPL